MNYYWWRATDLSSGNVYAENEISAYKTVDKAFGVTTCRVELVEENVKENRFTGEKYHD
jgi:hypothetical protein